MLNKSVAVMNSIQMCQTAMVNLLGCIILFFLYIKLHKGLILLFEIDSSNQILICCLVLQSGLVMLILNPIKSLCLMWNSVSSSSVSKQVYY